MKIFVLALFCLFIRGKNTREVELFDFSNVEYDISHEMSGVVININGIGVDCPPMKVPKYIKNRDFSGVSPIPAHIKESYAVNGYVAYSTNNRVYFTSGPKKDALSVSVAECANTEDTEVTFDGIAYDKICLLCGLVHHGDVITVEERVVARKDDKGVMRDIYEDDCEETFDFSKVEGGTIQINGVKCPRPSYISFATGIQHNNIHLNGMQAIGEMPVERSDEGAYITTNPNEKKIYIPEKYISWGVVRCVVHHGDFITIGDKIVHRFIGKKECYPKTPPLVKEKQPYEESNLDEMTPKDIVHLLKTLDWDDGRIGLLKRYLKDRTISCQDLAGMLKTFSWDKGRLEVCGIAKVSDPENFKKIVNAMQWDNSKVKVFEMFW
jgi:hypothetical protein